MLGMIWRFFASLLDWRLLLRKIKGLSDYDVVFITNIRDEVDKKRFLGKYVPEFGHFNGPRYYLNGISGRTRAIYSLSEDIVHLHSSLRAKEQCVAAIEHAQEKGAKVILLAASTKRLFGIDGAEIKDMFPGLLFTIGDNGTFYLLLSETLRAFNKSGLESGKSRICVIGPYGFLGELMVQYLTERGYDVIGVGPSKSRLDKMRKKYGIDVADSFENVGKVDAVVACTHSSQVRLTTDSVEMLRKNGRKLLVVDVSEPSNLTEEEYMKCSDVVIRQDAGNGYSKKLKYVLGFITYKMFRLSRGITFGCFMEALVWYSAIKDDPNNESLRTVNLFNFSQENMDLIASLFSRYKVNIPYPRCFGRKVKSFDLCINPYEIINEENHLVYIQDDDETKMI